MALRTPWETRRRPFRNLGKLWEARGHSRHHLVTPLGGLGPEKPWEALGSPWNPFGTPLEPPCTPLGHEKPFETVGSFRKSFGGLVEARSKPLDLGGAWWALEAKALGNLRRPFEDQRNRHCRISWDGRSPCWRRSRCDRRSPKRSPPESEFERRSNEVGPSNSADAPPNLVACLGSSDRLEGSDTKFEFGAATLMITVGVDVAFADLTSPTIAAHSLCA